MRQRFFMMSEAIFQFYPTKNKNKTFTWQRHVYIHDVAKGGDFYNGGLWIFYVFCRTQLKFRF